MRIAIVGAGGVGGYCSGLLARSGHDVQVLARGENLAVLQRRGVRGGLAGGTDSWKVRKRKCAWTSIGLLRKGSKQGMLEVDRAGDRRC